MSATTGTATATTAAVAIERPSESGEVIIQIRNLKKYFPVQRGLALLGAREFLKAVDDVSFDIKARRTFGLVGESGCGKTTTAKLLLGLEVATDGQILFHGRDIAKVKSRAFKREYRSSVQAVFQDPWASLNPRMRVRSIVGEPLEINTSMSRREITDRVGELLEEVGLNPYQMNLYPHEFSGGQRQRIGVARSLALNPDVVVLDEPVSALDVSIRAQIMNLLADLQAEHGLGYLLIAHNLATVRYMCHEMAVMYVGEIVEIGNTEDIFNDPLHPYTRALISAALPSHPDIQREEIVLTGEVPSPVNPPSGCRFHPRCPEFIGDVCVNVHPVLQDEHQPGHRVACHLYD